MSSCRNTRGQFTQCRVGGAARGRGRRGRGRGRRDIVFLGEGIDEEGYGFVVEYGRYFIEGTLFINAGVADSPASVQVYKVWTKGSWVSDKELSPSQARALIQREGSKIEAYVIAAYLGDEEGWHERSDWYG